MGKTVGRDKTYTYEAGNDSFTFYIDFSITTDYGSDELEIQVDIVSLLSPKILLAVPEEGYIVPVGVDLELKPEVINSENTEYTWTVYGEKKSDQKDFIFNSSKIGMYEVVLIAKNADGEGVLKFNVKVCTSEEMPFEWMWETETFNLTIGRTAFIRSYWIKNAFDATYSWQVDGSDEIVQTGHECLFAYKPETQGTHPVTVTMKNQYIERKKTFTVNVYPPVQPRPITATSKATADHGYFFLLAPAQHVNRGNSETVIPFANQAAVNAFIYDHPGSTEFGASLGAWGGYLMVGFDHSVENSGAYDLAIKGNQFPGWSEPGIVWVMQDENGDGEPNDTWCELKGSLYEAEGYVRDYAVTYCKGRIYEPIIW